MTFKRAKLLEYLDRVNRDDSIFSPRFMLDHKGNGAQNVGQIRQDQLPYFFAMATAKYDDADVKMAAAFCLGRLSWAILRPLAGYAVNGVWLDVQDLSAFELSTRQVPWQNDGKSDEFTSIDIALAPEQTGWTISEATPRVIAQFSANLEALLEPLVDLHFEESKLSKAALWRLIGDSLAVAFLAQGRNFGCETHAMEIAEQILRLKGRKLFSKQTGFIEVRLPERPDISEWFRKRGGCCRYYTSNGGDYCSTCVLRDETSRNDRLENYLRNKLLGDEAA